MDTDIYVYIYIYREREREREETERERERDRERPGDDHQSWPDFRPFSTVRYLCVNPKVHFTAK